MRHTSPQLYNFLIANGVANTPAFIDQAILNWGGDINNVYEHLDSYLARIHEPYSAGPIEKHPYIDLYSADCDFQRHTLVLGTFPPSSYLNNLPMQNLPNPNVQNNNPTHFFYGNMNNFWKYLFSGNQVSITIPYLQQQLKNHGISISDVFAFVQRKRMISPSDQDLKNIVLNCEISNVFKANSGIRTILFTSGKLQTFFNNQVSTLSGFRWILEDCCGGLNGFTISGEISGNGAYYPLNQVGLQNAVQQQNGGIVWWLKSQHKTIRIVNLPSPAGQAAIQMVNDPFYIKWLNYKDKRNEPILNPPTVQYRQEVYQMVLNNTIHLI
jgi:hypothetical protein